MLFRKVALIFTVALLACRLSFAQKFAPRDLQNDLAFIKHQVFTVQANPFTELTQKQYEKVFDAARAKLTDAMTAAEFYRLVKPLVSWTSDEHAGITAPDSVAVFAENALLLPFAVSEQGNAYMVDTLLAPANGIAKGALIKKINGTGINDVLQQCAGFTVGFPAQRMHNAEKYLGYLYGLANPGTGSYTITLQDERSITVPGVPLAAWQRYVQSIMAAPQNCPQKISYQKAGNTGYINACSFLTRSDEEYAAIGRTIDSIYNRAAADGVENLIIDVSRNSGGNSAVGDLLIAGFYDQPYRTYQCNWKRSDEYLATMKGWGMRDDRYERLKPGAILHFDSDTIRPRAGKRRFKGKVYVLIGAGTFSSAMMFATIIKDNKIAPLIGQTPDGHPSHFGEMYYTTVPHTRLGLRLGVKEWIRPAGKTGENELTPDIPLALPAYAETSAAALNNRVQAVMAAVHANTGAAATAPLATPAP
jgi:hypothetical protein